MTNRLIVAEFGVTVAVVTYVEIVKNGRVPLPSRYIGAGVAFGILGLLSPLISDRLAATLGLGIVLTVLYQGLPQEKPLNPVRTT